MHLLAWSGSMVIITSFIAKLYSMKLYIVAACATSIACAYCLWFICFLFIMNGEIDKHVLRFSLFLFFASIAAAAFTVYGAPFEKDKQFGFFITFICLLFSFLVSFFASCFAKIQRQKNSPKIHNVSLRTTLTPQ
jgi:tellurite resistance protein TehA-like permease